MSSENFTYLQIIDSVMRESWGKKGIPALSGFGDSPAMRLHKIQLPRNTHNGKNGRPTMYYSAVLHSIIS